MNPLIGTASAHGRPSFSGPLCSRQVSRFACFSCRTDGVGWSAWARTVGELRNGAACVKRVSTAYRCRCSVWVAVPDDPQPPWCVRSPSAPAAPQAGAFISASPQLAGATMALSTDVPQPPSRIASALAARTRSAAACCSRARPERSALRLHSQQIRESRPESRHMKGGNESEESPEACGDRACSQCRSHRSGRGVGRACAAPQRWCASSSPPHPGW